MNNHLDFNNYDLSVGQSQLIAIMRSHIRIILTDNSSKQLQSIKWLFEDQDIIGHLSLKDCCNSLEIPHNLIKIRMQYEIYNQHKIFMNLINSRLPDVLRDEILVNSGLTALSIAEKIWNNPGIRKDALMIDSVINHNLDDALENLKKRYLITNDVNYYLTGRISFRNQPINWTKCWNFYD